MLMSFWRNVLGSAAILLAAASMLGAQSTTPGSAQPKVSGTDCPRVCLLDILSNYLDALVKHDPSHLPVAQNLRVTENGQEIKLGEGIWKTAASFSYRQSFADASTGQAGFFGVVEENDSAGEDTFALRLKISGRKIAEIETMVGRTGAHPIFSPEALLTPKAVWNDFLAVDERSPRAAMIAAADSYFEGIQTHKPEIIPFHPDCNRTENGTQTTNNPPRFPLNCRDSIAGLTYISRVRDRRYPIVDPERGLVFAIVQFDIPGNLESTPPTADIQLQGRLREARSLLLFELFKVENGRIREIEAFMTNEKSGALTAWPQ
jgi:hypothetical protein